MLDVRDIDGIIVARSTANEAGVTVQLMAPSGFLDGQGYYPAESLTIDTVEGIRALRDLCEELIATHDELAQAKGE